MPLSDILKKKLCGLVKRLNFGDKFFVPGDRLLRGGDNTVNRGEKRKTR